MGNGMFLTGGLPGISWGIIVGVIVTPALLDGRLLLAGLQLLGAVVITAISILIWSRRCDSEEPKQQ